MSRLRLALPAVCLLVAVSGCGSARMLSYNADSGVGVVAVPNNYNFWPLKYRDDADKLIAQKCPNGYDIVEEKEAVVGQKATTNHFVDSSMTSVSAQTEYRITFRARAGAPPVVMTLPPGAPIAPPGLGLPPRPVPINP